jgi:hypothetical protein
VSDVVVQGRRDQSRFTEKTNGIQLQLLEEAVEERVEYDNIKKDLEKKKQKQFCLLDTTAIADRDI